MLTVGDLMTRQVFTLPASLSLGGAAWALMHRGVSGAPVCDDEGNVVGVLSETELLEARVEMPDGGAEPGGDAEDDDLCVADVMTPAVLAVGTNEPIAEVVELMTIHGAHRVLVVDEAGAIAGIITTVDLLRHLADGRLSPSRDLVSPAPSPAASP
jgi:predicted transcriptional regulator